MVTSNQVQIGSFELTTRPPWKTTVGDVSLYDNIWVHAEHTYNSEYKGECGVLEFDKIIYDDVLEEQLSMK